MTETTPSRHAALGWVATGTTLLSTHLAGLDDSDLDAPCSLPGWTRRHLLAHIASNAEAIERLLVWATTGVETPMYSSARQRADDIEAGAQRYDLCDWVRASFSSLDRSFAGMSSASWNATVVTAQGRSVPASETVWMRAREVCVHAVDLDCGSRFEDLPQDFNDHLIADIARKRAATRDGPTVVVHEGARSVTVLGDGQPVLVELPDSAAAAAWLSGRATGTDLPTLPAWL